MASSPYSYTSQNSPPETSESEEDQQFDAYKQLSDNIIDRGARTPSSTFIIPPVERSIVITSGPDVIQPKYVKTTVRRGIGDALDVAYAAAERYKVLFIHRSEPNLEYRTNLRRSDAYQGFTIHTGISVFLTVDGKFMPPRQINTVNPQTSFSEQINRNLINQASEYEVVVVSAGSLNIAYYSKYGGVLRYVVHCDEDLPYDLEDFFPTR